jgi:hypothetical protein
VAKLHEKKEIIARPALDGKTQKINGMICTNQK